MKRLILSITLLVFMALGSFNAMAMLQRLSTVLRYLTMVSKLRMARVGVVKRR